MISWAFPTFQTSPLPHAHLMKRFVCAIVCAVTSFLPAASNAQAAETATLKIRFEYAGAPPVMEKIKIKKDKAFCGKHDLLDESILVNKENKGLKNVAFFVYTGRRGTKVEDLSFELEPKEITLANKDCRFEPHVVVAHVGDTLEVTNPDAVLHNANMQFFNNKAVNPSIPAGQKFVYNELKEAEPGMVQVDCNVHDWMKARIIVLDHPFGGISDENGELVIEGLPVGQKLKFRPLHEVLKFRDVTDKDGEDVEIKRGTIELELEAGENDLGTWIIPEAK